METMIDPLELHRRLLKIRRGEELLARLYKSREMKTPTHFSIGQEAVSVGVCAALNLPHDVVFTHHRSHAAYLACGASFYKLAAELYGKEDGCSRGRGGSVHLTARDVGFIASSAILGQTIAAATGAALAFKMRKEPHVAVTFFGEAACEEGVFYESLNYAALNKLPVLFVCENNGYSTESPLNKRFPNGTSLCDRAYSFGVAVKKVDGNSIRGVYEATIKALELARAGQPVFLECATYRWLEHVGPNYDHESGRAYRTEAELRSWQLQCPLKKSTAGLLAKGISQVELDAMDDDISASLEADAALARVAAPAHGLMENVY